MNWLDPSCRLVWLVNHLAGIGVIAGVWTAALKQVEDLQEGAWQATNVLFFMCF